MNTGFVADVSTLLLSRCMPVRSYFVWVCAPVEEASFPPPAPPCCRDGAGGAAQLGMRESNTLVAALKERASGDLRCREGRLNRMYMVVTLNYIYFFTFTLFAMDFFSLIPCRHVQEVINLTLAVFQVEMDCH